MRLLLIAYYPPTDPLRARYIAVLISRFEGALIITTTPYIFLTLPLIPLAYASHFSGNIIALITIPAA